MTYKSPILRITCVWLLTALWAFGAQGVAAKMEEGRGNASFSVIVSGGSMMNGDHFKDAVLPAMREHYSGCKAIALVLHATHPKDRDRMEERLQKAFAHMNGARAESLHHLDEAGQKAYLEKVDGIFVGGGETFVLLRELYRTGQLELIRSRVRAGVPYMGASAGANIAGTRIGTTNDFPVADIPTRDALGFIQASINPHHPVPASDAEFKARAGKIRIYLKFNSREKVLGLADAAIVRLHGGRAVLLVGAAWVYGADSMREIKLGGTIPELEQ